MTKSLLSQLEADAKAYSEDIDKQIGHEKHRRIKTVAYYSYLEAAKKYQGELQAAEERMERMVDTIRNSIRKNLAAEMDGNSNIRNFIIEFQQVFNEYNNRDVT